MLRSVQFSIASLALVLGFILADKASCQSPALLKSNQASKRGAGSASVLRGSTLVVSVFVSDQESAWSASQIASVRAKVAQSFRFIANHARRFGVKVDFREFVPETAPYQLPIPTDTFANPTWTKHVLEQGIGFSGNRLVDHLKNEQQVDHVVICLHVNKRALSYNLAYYDNVDPAYKAERMICYTKYPDGRDTAAATYAHEILHLFGAGDLYFPYDKDRDRKSAARRHFPNDIMLRVDYDMSRLTIGSFTAYRIGWVDSLKPELASFED